MWLRWDNPFGEAREPLYNWIWLFFYVLDLSYPHANYKFLKSFLVEQLKSTTKYLF